MSKVMEFNVYSAKLKEINKDGSVTSTEKFVYRRHNNSRAFSPKYVADPQIIKAKDSKDLMRKMLKKLRYSTAGKYNKYFVLQIKTTKGQYYFSNLK